MKSPNEELTEEKRAVIEEYENSLLVPYQKAEHKHNLHPLGWHPLIAHKISMMRNLDTNSSDFRRLVEEVTTLICCEAM